MSQFIKKLKEIKKETFRLNDFYTQELIELFDFQNKEDKNFILWNNEKSNFYEWDIYNLLKTLLSEDKLKDTEKEELIENYRNKFLGNNSSISQTYSLVYLDLFIDYYKTKDYKTLFRQLYDNSDNELVEKFTNIFREIKDEEYFVKSFNVFLWEETRYWNKYLTKINIEFLLSLKNENFIFFIKDTSNEWFAYLKELDLEKSNAFIEKVKLLWNSDINNKLKSQLLWIIEKLTDKENYNYDKNRIYEQFIKSDFCKLLGEYLWKMFTNLSLDIFDKIQDLFLWYWDVVILISNILNKDNIKSIIEKSWKNFYDVFIYENIEWWIKKGKKKLLEEFKKYENFNEKLKQRKETLEKNKSEQKERENKEKEKFFSWINKIIDEEKKDLKWISEYLLYHFDENTYKIQEDKEIIKIVKKQVRRFFKLPYSNPELYELKYTRKDEHWSSYTTHQFVVNHTFLRCLKFYQQFWFKINNDIKRKAIRYSPFAYENDLEDIFSIVWNSELWKDDIDYLLSVYDWTRTKDDLKYHNISSFTWFYEKYKDSFIKYWKIEIQNTFIKIINDEKYNSYERKYIAEKLAEIWEEEQLFELFNKYKSDESYFSNTEKLTLSVIFWKSVVKRFPNSKGKTEIINWFIKQLREAKISIPEVDYWEWMRWISWIESELSWDLDKEESFISVFKYINDLSFEKNIKEILNYSFEIIKEPKKDYRIYWNYLQQAVFNFYEGIEKKNLKKIFELEKEISEKVKDDETRILFKVNFLDKLISIYSENVDKWKIHEIYKGVYKVKITERNEILLLENMISLLKEEKEKMYKPLIITEWKTDWKHLKNAISKLQSFDNLKNDNILFHEFEDDDKKIDWSSDLVNLLKYLWKIWSRNIVIWIFDRDENHIINIHKNEKDEIKKWWNNVFSFCIPVPKNREKYNKISIEFYYTDEEIKTVCENKWTRLFFSNEIEEMVSKNQTNKKNINIKYNILKDPLIDDEYDKKIFDENIDKIVNWDWLKMAHSKNYFAENILKWKEWFNNFNLNNFDLIFSIIDKIISKTTSK